MQRYEKNNALPFRQGIDSGIFVLRQRFHEIFAVWVIGGC